MTSPIPVPALPATDRPAPATRISRMDGVQIALAIGCGLAWGHPAAPWAISIAALLPLLWIWSQSRLAASLLVLAYYLTAARGLPQSAAIFFGETASAAIGGFLWLAAAILNAAPWALLWHRDKKSRVRRLPLALLATALPPIGIIGWTHPLVAAGYLFPGTALAGLALLYLLIWLPARGHYKALALLLGISAILNLAYRAPATTWTGMDTHYGRLANDSLDFLAAYERIMDVQRIAHMMPSHRVAVLPETVLGRWTSITAQTLAATQSALAAKHSRLIVGAEVGQGNQYRNVLIVLGAARPQILDQRVPVPISMWQPWHRSGALANPWGDGLATLPGINPKMGYFICYEQALVFPALRTMLKSPQIVIGASNTWWSRSSTVPAILTQTMTAWGRLFHVPVILARNLY